MRKPLIFDPSTGELISSAREADIDRGKSAVQVKTFYTDPDQKTPDLEASIFSILCNGSLERRLDALRVIAGTPHRKWSPRVAAAVVCQLEPEDDLLRREALELAGKLGFQAAVQPVVELLMRKGSLPAKIAALQLVENYGAQGTALADGILPLLENPQTALAEAASRALGSIGLTASSVRELESLIRHKEARVRTLCVDMLGMLGARAAAVSGLVVLRLDDPVPSVRVAAAAALKNIGFSASAMDEINRMLNHGSNDRRMEMLGILAHFGSSAQQSAQHIVPLLQSESTELRDAARRTLHVVGLGQDCLKAIEHLARHPSHDIRCEAMDLLEECGSAPESCALAMSLMADRDLELRERASHVIARNGVPTVTLPALRKLLRDDRADVRILTLSAIKEAARNAYPAAKLVCERIEDADMEVATQAASAFAALDAVEDALNIVARVLGNRRQDRRLLMLHTLRGMGPQAAETLPLVTAAMGDRDWVVRDAACETFIAIGFHDSCLPEVRKLIEHQDRNYRLAVIRALGACGMNASAAVSFLTQRRNDSDAEVGRAARAALESVCGEKSDL